MAFAAVPTMRGAAVHSLSSLRLGSTPVDSGPTGTGHTGSMPGDSCGGT